MNVYEYTRNTRIRKYIHKNTQEYQWVMLKTKLYTENTNVIHPSPLHKIFRGPLIFVIPTLKLPTIF